ncbi:MAG: LacI family transcriptional regulator [Clostridiales bacterium]|jgi:LacI family transcriptional regulator|nr:LacI family transcriptional regulator [Clostridiales bacterium]
MTTRKDVAEVAGVSVATVSNVFLNKRNVTAEKIDLVRDAARKLKYVPNHVASSLRSGRCGHIAVVVNEYTNPYHLEIVRGVEGYAAQNGYMVSILLMHGELGKRLDFLRTRTFDAVINMTTIFFPTELVDVMRSRNTVLIGFGPDLGTVMRVRYTAAMDALMKRAAELGHVKVGYVSTMDEWRFRTDDRGAAFLNFREKHGFSTDGGLAAFHGGDWRASECVGYELTKGLLTRKPEITAIFAANDLAAIGVMRAAAEAGRRVPDNLSVIGCDDIEIGAYLKPSLTTMRIDKDEYGGNIARAVIGAIASGQEGNAPVEAVAEPVYRESLAACENA